MLIQLITFLCAPWDTPAISVSRAVREVTPAWAGITNPRKRKVSTAVVAVY